MKTFKSVFIIIVVLAIAVSILGKVNKDKTTTENIPPLVSAPEIDLSPEVKAIQMCYIWNTEAGDKATLSMDIRAENVIGEFNWLPAEKDKKIGIFKGTVGPVDKMMMARTANVLWEAQAEGTIVTEELKIIFGDGAANPGFGEMKDRGDGVYVYANPDKIDYSLNLQQTDCGDEAMD